VTSGRAAAAVKACIESKNRVNPLWNQRQRLAFNYLPKLTQHDFDHLLWACDLNFVRGEDSLVRALWADKPFIWQIYPQHDQAHHRKLEAFLKVLDAPASLRIFHRVWNGMSGSTGANEAALPALEPVLWQQAVHQMRSRQLQQDDLVSRLLRFVSKNH